MKHNKVRRNSHEVTVADVVPKASSHRPRCAILYTNTGPGEVNRGQDLSEPVLVKNILQTVCTTRTIKLSFMDREQRSVPLHLFDWVFPSSDSRH
jgi:hypothetical protein